MRVKSCDSPATSSSRLCRTRGVLIFALNRNPVRKSFSLLMVAEKLCAVPDVPVYRQTADLPCSRSGTGTAPSKVVLTPTSKIMVGFCTDYFESLTSDKKGGRASVGPVDLRLLQKRLSFSLHVPFECTPKPHCVALLSENKETSQ